MAQKKLLRFAQLKTFEHVLEKPDSTSGNWKKHFKNNHPIVVELACGRGEYTIGMAQLYPQKNFIGIDIKGNRMYIGAKIAQDIGLGNVAFLRTQIEALSYYFNNGEVDEIWLTFPDPHLRISKAKKRLTHPRFLRQYLQVLKPGGSINLKTDSPNLYRFTKQIIDMYGLTIIVDTANVYASQNILPELHIKTHYEKMDIAGSKTIHYLKFSLPEILIDIDTQLHCTLVEQNDIQP